LVPPERQDEVSQLLERIKRGEHVERYETVRLKKDGSEINVSLTISPIRNAQGRITGASTIARDVTQRKRAEEALRESEEKYRTLFEESFDGLFITSPGGRILDMNKKGVAMFGYDTKEEIMSLDLERDVYAHPPDRRRILSMVNAQGSAEYEVVVKKKSAEHMITHCSLAAVRDEKDVITSYRGIIRDITERKRAEEELNQYRRHLEDLVTERTQELEERTRELETANMRLREADRLKSVFLASMSHELRTPLNSIIGFTGIMLMGMAGKLNEEQERQLTMVKNGANHLLGLINDLLDIAKIEAGRVTLSLERFELEEVVDSVIETVSPMAEGKGLLLVRDIPSGLALFSDKRRVKQILMNIIGNAVKFTEHGSIKIAVGVLGDKNVELRFTDTGIGIKQENMKVLFSPFQQIDTSLTKAYEGTGLGLYLSKRLASLLGGDITASSTYGKGSEFTVVLPLAYGGPHEKKDTGG
jgi:PAS domain S-box-containing protein